MSVGLCFSAAGDDVSNPQSQAVSPSSLLVFMLLNLQSQAEHPYLFLSLCQCQSDFAFFGNSNNTTSTATTRRRPTIITESYDGGEKDVGDEDDARMLEDGEVSLVLERGVSLYIQV